jgi:hypothetical protein
VREEPLILATNNETEHMAPCAFCGEPVTLVPGLTLFTEHTRRPVCNGCGRDRDSRLPFLAGLARTLASPQPAAEEHAPASDDRPVDLRDPWEYEEQEETRLREQWNAQLVRLERFIQRSVPPDAQPDARKILGDLFNTGSSLILVRAAMRHRVKGGYGSSGRRN